MNLMEMVKKKIRSFLEIKEPFDNNITLRNLRDFETEANISRVWSWGDSNAIEQMYKQLNGDNGLSFWSAVPSMGIVKRHTGLPGAIVSILSSLIVADLNGITIPENRKIDWEDANKLIDFEELITECIEETFIAGDGAFVISAQEGKNELPYIEFIPGERVEIERNHGKLVEVSVKNRFAHGGCYYVHKEIYGYGYIRNELYRDGTLLVWGNLNIPRFQGVPEVIYHDKSFIMAVPIKFFNSNKHKGRGKGLLIGKFENFDALDEVWSQWMEALRKGRSKEYIPKGLLPVNPDTGELMKPNDFDNSFIALEDAMGENAKSETTLRQPSIPHESYLSTYVTALDLCLQGIVSPSTLGIDVKKMDNAEAQREKEKATLYTRNKVVSALQKKIPILIDTYFKVLDSLRKKQLTYTDSEIVFGEYANPSFESQVETVSKAKSGGIMSLEASVDELYGDSKDDEWKREEVARLKEEQGIAVMEEPEVRKEIGVIGFEGGYTE